MTTATPDAALIDRLLAVLPDAYAVRVEHVCPECGQARLLSYLLPGVAYTDSTYQFCGWVCLGCDTWWNSTREV